MRTLDQMVQREVMCCMSHLVSALGQAYGSARTASGELTELTEQAFELCAPIPDYEEAATQAGWGVSGENGAYVFDHEIEHQSVQSYPTPESAWQACCEENSIEPYDREVFEHWAVTQWLADKLIEAGEKVDTDFGGLNVWARTCSGQGIASDGVIERIYAGMMK